MRKRYALLLTMVLILSAAMTPLVTKQASAASDKARQAITALGVMNTDRGSDSKGTDKVTRDRFAQMLVNLSSQKGKVTGNSNVSLFSDVSRKYWAAGYIQTAVTQGWMSGYLNGSFKPGRGITLQEAVNAVLKLLGYGSSDFAGNLSGGQMALYASKGLNQNISRTKTSYLTVDDCINLFYNTLNATTKDGKVYAETLGYSLNSNGELDYLSLINTGTKGPVIADEDWKSEIPFSTAAATYYKDGKKSSYSDINDYDVLYYSESLKTIWAYDEKVTGTVESINPDQLTPKSVTVFGKDYTLASSEASITFSTLGTVRKGDIVTLLLGKDNTVAGVLSVDEYNMTITGVALKTGSHLTEAADGSFLLSNYVVFVDAAGNEYQQDYKETEVSFMAGDLVRVTYKDGIALVSKYELESTSFGNNTVNADGTKLGETKLASNVKILDLREEQYINIYPERLAGVTLSASVIYYELNSDGEISQLILNNVTGDMYQYGIFTGLSILSDKAVYEYLIGGVKGSLTSNSFGNFDTETGPKGFIFDGNILTAAFHLSGGSISSIGTTAVQVRDSKFPLADGYNVYYYKDGEYLLTTLDKVSDLSKYNLTAYCDEPVSFGGRVRIIVAESKA